MRVGNFFVVERTAIFSRNNYNCTKLTKHKLHIYVTATHYNLHAVIQSKHYIELTNLQYATYSLRLTLMCGVYIRFLRYDYDYLLFNTVTFFIS